jgi:hypothetical protein
MRIHSARVEMRSILQVFGTRTKMNYVRGVEQWSPNVFAHAPLCQLK